MFTDPTHIRIEDPGKLEGNTVFTYLDAFCRPEYFPEFLPYEGSCRFQGCVHIHEPGCAVKAALEDGKVDAGRYASYVSFFEELKEKEKRRY